MIDVLPEVERWLGWLDWLSLLVVAPVVVGFLLMRYALPIRLATAISGVGTVIVVFLASRLYKSQVDYCRDSPEVAAGGDKFSCLEPQHWFAFQAALAVLLLAELYLAIILAAGLVHWRKQRRL